MHNLRVLAPLALIAVSCVNAQSRIPHYGNSLAPYVNSPESIVERMLEIADLKPNETLYDLGSGDGRIIIMAAQRYHAKTVGVEISERLVKQTTERINAFGLKNLASVMQADLLNVDLSPADVVTIYLMTNSNEILRPRLEKYLRAGARVVSHEYPVPGWKAKYVEKTDPNSRHHVIYLYTMPAQK